MQDVPGWADGTDLNQYVRALVSFILTMREQVCHHGICSIKLCSNAAQMQACFTSSIWH
jgi:hypothetical protein